MSGKKWFDIPEYQGLYQVSKDGEVRSLYKNTKNKTGILRVKLTPGGYPKVNLYRNGKQTTFTVHGLMRRTFWPDAKSGMVINHLDLNKQNNKLSNLELCTYKENTRHASRNGVFKNRPGPKGASNAKAKMNEEQVREARKLYKNGVSVKDLCFKFGLKSTAMRYLLSGKHWSHVK